MARKDDILSIYTKEVEGIKEAGLFKGEAPFVSPQGARVKMEDGRELLCMCANNYLGLGDNPRLIEAAKRTYDEKGYGVASVRFICGTQDIHKKLEKKISGFLGTDDTILYSSCFDANGGLFETILTAEDAVISDELNHASIIDGVRLCKAKRFRYKNNDMKDLEAKLKEADEAGARIKLIATDGVFSMDGIICNLKGVCDLADKYNALVMVDDSHAVGFVGKTGRGTAEYCGVEGRVDIITGTLGKALGGASGGYTSGRKEIIDLLRQRSRPYLFSNSLAPAIAGASLELFDMLEESTELRDHLEEVTAYYRKQLVDNGFDIIPGTHPCVPVMLYDEKTAAEFAKRMMEKGVYVVAFSYPVVPKGKARIRTQVCASHTKEDIDFIVKCFIEVREEMGLNDPFFVQYGRWLGNCLQGDFGKSYSLNKPVTELLAERLWPTLKLTLMAMLLMLVLSIPLGMASALKKDTWIDYLVRGITFIGCAMPNFWVGLLLMMAFCVYFQIFPVISSAGDFKSLFLPALTLAIAMTSKYTRQVRSAVLAELEQEYVAGARARGLSENRILFGNVLKSVLLRMVTLLFLSAGSLLGGTAIVETIFMWNGVGKMAVDAVSMHDIPVIQAYLVWMAAIYLLLHLIADLLMGALDPRAKLEGMR